MIRSMTGFGAGAAADEAGSARVEVRAVNHRGLQVKVRLPSVLAHVEPDVEAAVRAQLERGAVSVSVEVQRANAATAARIDRAALARYHAELVESARAIGIDAHVSLDALLELPGVVVSGEDDAAREHDGLLVLRATSAALAQLAVMREREGALLRADVEKHAATIRDVATQLARRMPQVLVEHHASLRKRLDELLSNQSARPRPATVTDQDIARELALLADRMDTSEELARLDSHLAQLAKILAKGGSVGRSLDFLAQELFREANTIGAKCNDAQAAHLVVELKTAIERLREQVQNVE